MLSTAPGAQGQTRPAVTNGTQVPPEVREMQAVEDRWTDAINKRDQYGLELVLAPQFIGVSASGDVTTRDQQIGRLFIKGEEPVSIEQKVISTRFIGDVAIVNGTYVKHWKLDKGPLDEQGIYLHVFERRGGGWLCLNSQQTVVAERGKAIAAAKSKAAPKSSSSASLPFHIPLIYKGPSSSQPAPAPGSNEPQN
jgi:ketosteroid isomerase-like protein